jgi:hypothetical protein
MFSSYIYGKHFIIHTDHKALVWLNKHKDQKSKLMRWLLKLQEYDYEIVHRSGKENGNTDALSCLTIETKKEVAFSLDTYRDEIEED